MSRKIKKEEKINIENSYDELEKKELISLLKEKDIKILKLSKKDIPSRIRNCFVRILVCFSLAVLLLAFVTPTVKVQGNSMENTINQGDILTCVKKHDFKRGDIIAFNYDNKLFIKRVIAIAGESVDIDDAGNVFVNKEYLEEDYLSLAKCSGGDIEFPQVVPAGKYFVLSDNRKNCADSRNEKMSTISKDQIKGKVFIRLFPFNRVRLFK